MSVMTHNLPEAPATTANLAVRTVGLRKSIDDRAILRGVDLQIEAGTFAAILGANGAGKSTLLRIIATLAAPTDGQVYLFGQPAKASSASLRARIGLIADQSMLYRELTARENLEFFASLYGLKNPNTRALRALEGIGMTTRANDPV